MSRSKRPPLRLPHSEERIRSNPYFGYWERQSTDDIVESLRPDARDPLLVRPDGTVVDGNTRTFILQQRGYDVNSLPRTPSHPIPMEFPSDD